MKKLQFMALQLLFGSSLILATDVDAAVTVSSGATSNMVCLAGICRPIAKNAIFNISELESRLASRNITLTTTGSDAQANDIVVSGPLTWSTANALTLDAGRSIAINKPVLVAGEGGLALLTNDGGVGGRLSFGTNGNVTFQNLSSALSIDGISYTLLDSIADLASAIAADPGGNFVLSASYDATADGTYSNAPIVSPFNGRLEGLGNTISNLSINSTQGNNLALFAELDSPGRIADIRLARFKIQEIESSVVGGLVAFNNGTLSGDFAGGEIFASSNSSTIFGILVGLNAGGSVGNSHSSGSLHGGNIGAAVGGLVGQNYDRGTINDSFSSAMAVSNAAYVGGLVGNNQVKASVANSYATGTVTGGSNSAVGGLFGCLCSSLDTLSASYSTGLVTGGRYAGGLIGRYSGGTITDTYWDTTTSGIGNPSQGAGNSMNVRGITGLTTSQLQSHLPAGFNPSVWGQNEKVNGGLPYLLGN